MIRSFRGNKPKIADSAYVDPGAHVIGDVEIGAGSSVWPTAVLRGDIEPIRVGAMTNIQDGTLIHTDRGFPAVIGDRVTVGHAAVLHGCTVGDNSLIGMGAIMMNGVKIGTNSLVGAGSVVPEGKSYPDNSLIVGSPAKAIRTLDERLIEMIRGGADIYVRRSQRYAKGLTRIG